MAHVVQKRGVSYKGGPYGQLGDVQIDTVALRKRLLVDRNVKGERGEERERKMGD